MDKIIFVNLFDCIKKEISELPLGVLSLATKLSQNEKYDIEVIDFQYEFVKGRYEHTKNFSENVENMRSLLLNKNPQIVSIYTMCNTYHIAVILAKKIKESNPKVKIVFGGPQATLTAIETLREFPWIDVIGLGEGENSIDYIVENLLEDKEFSDEPGVAYIKDGIIINNELPKMIEDLDQLPLPDYSFFDMDVIKSVSIDAGRGCPFSCTFCSTKNFWKRKFRLKSSQRIIKELKFIIEKYGISTFSFMHDLFTANKRKLIEICDLIIEEGLDIKWTCSSRVDTIDEEMIIKMAQSGCTGVFLGIETGSQRMQKILNKNLDLSKVYEVVDFLITYNIHPRLSFIYGFPNEAEEDVRATIKMIEMIEILVRRKSGFRNCIQLHRLAFFPGTELTNKYMDELVYSEANNSTILYTNELQEEVKKIIGNKALFPQFYEYRTDLRDRLTMLEKFIPIVYIRTLNAFKDTYKMIMKHYNNDFLAFYDDYKKIEEESLRVLSFFNVNEGDNKLFRPFDSIFSFVNKHDFGKRDKLIKEMAKFEHSMADFLYESEEEQKIIRFDLDVYSAKKNNCVEGIDGPIQVLLTRQDDKKIRILKIS